jgi:hypothetical protein
MGLDMASPALFGGDSLTRDLKIALARCDTEPRYIFLEWTHVRLLHYAMLFYKMVSAHMKSPQRNVITTQVYDDNLPMLTHFRVLLGGVSGATLPRNDCDAIPD